MLSQRSPLPLPFLQQQRFFPHTGVAERHFSSSSAEQKQQQQQQKQKQRKKNVWRALHVAGAGVAVATAACVALRRRRESAEDAAADAALLAELQATPPLSAADDEAARFALCRSLSLTAVFALPALAAPLCLNPLAPSALGDAWWRLFYGALARAGPVWVKFSQWLATRVDVLPPRLCARLALMQTRCPTHGFAATRAEVEALLGGAPLAARFAAFEAAPLASGAVAQVHRAVLRDGTPVAVKVLHPLGAQRVADDLRLIRRAAALFGALPGMRWMGLPAAAADFSARLSAHLDLRREACNLRAFRRHFGRRGPVQFPRPIPGLASKSVLVETLVADGTPLADFVRCSNAAIAADADSKPTTPPKAVSNAARLCLRAYLKMVFQDNLVHSDLHPGNMLVHTSSSSSSDSAVPGILHRAWDRICGKPAVTIIDAGLVTEVSPEEREDFLTLCNHVASGNSRAAAELLVAHAPRAECTPKQREKFVNGMERLLDEFASTPVGKLPLVRMGATSTDLARSCNVQLRSGFASFFLSALILDGVGLQLFPKLNLVRVAAPYIAFAKLRQQIGYDR